MFVLEIDMFVLEIDMFVSVMKGSKVNRPGQRWRERRRKTL